MHAFTISDDSRKACGLNVILQALNDRCASSLAANRCLKLPLLSDGALVATAQQRVDEVRNLLRTGELLPIVGFDDITEQLARLAIEATLSGPELLRVAKVLEAISQGLRFAAVCPHSAPLLRAFLQTFPDVVPILRLLVTAILPDGSLCDEASVGLARARQQVRRISQTIRATMEALLNDEAMLPYLQDKYVSVRNDRYVLPILASFASRVPGIIHNASQTGLTVFIEPQAIIPMGNALALAQSVEKEEAAKVLTMLSHELSENHDAIAMGLEALIELDVLAAKGRLSDDLNLEVPTLMAPHEPLDLPDLRHPGLLLSGQRAVPSSPKMGSSHHVVMISGPNGGGKTVLLTAVGLAVLMSRLGLPIAASRGARLPLYQGMVCIVGDQQSIASGLSSFAAQLQALAAMARQVDASTLVLIDEMCGDTEPSQGGALGRAVLDHCAQKGAHVMVTTHLSALKALAITDERYINARMRYDGHNAAPTYTLEWGTAGQSRALDLALRVGLLPTIVAAAQNHLVEQGALDAALEKLEASCEALAAERKQVQKLKERLQQAQQEQQLRQQQQQERMAQSQKEHQQKMRANMQAAERTISEALLTLRQQRNIESAQRAKKALQIARQALPQPTQNEFEGLPPLQDAASLQVGQWVHVRSMGKVMRITHVAARDVTVAIGALRARVPVGDIALCPNEKIPPVAKAHRVKMPTAPSTTPPSQSRCDVRGLRIDEAQSKLVRALDVCLSEGSAMLFVVHGHGTGALREGLHDLLRGSPYVACYRLAESHEGGQGVTVVQLDR